MIKQYDTDDFWINYSDGTKKLDYDKVVGMAMINGHVYFSGIYVLIRLTHVFEHGTFSDCEELVWEDLKDFAEHYYKDPVAGHIIWTAKRRKMMPRQHPVDVIKSMGIWDLDVMGLEPNKFEEWAKASPV